ncbi:hypothetical protein [Variovorax sp. LT1R16]|uniref:hypothetical protein n=1 Tax=Variovorax sp. LT1R16 TaxID=3443728 RepID=UPI003F45E1B2
MTVLYELAVLGAPTDAILGELESSISAATAPFGLRLGGEIAWHVRPDAFDPAQTKSAAAVFFGAAGAPVSNIASLLRRGIPILPVVSDITKVHEEIPEVLRPLNCLAYNVSGVQRTTSALLECAGLLPRQRRVFVSYRRDEARQAALQLFDAFSARLFDVFLDTHGIAPAEDSGHAVASPLRFGCSGHARHSKLLRQPLDERRIRPCAGQGYLGAPRWLARFDTFGTHRDRKPS